MFCPAFGQGFLKIGEPAAKTGAKSWTRWESPIADLQKVGGLVFQTLNRHHKVQRLSMLVVVHPTVMRRQLAQTQTRRATLGGVI
jgi:hypothetical protein